MSYGLKYYHTHTRKSHEITLNIYQRDYAGASKEMGDLADLHLGLDGGCNDIYQPITKSILTFSLIDSNDKHSTSAIKYGNWEEFFTPDDTLYKVELIQDDVCRWRGYITPDSWEEDLEYRSIITITARDNIGHLNDFEFDGSGMIPIGSFISQALAKIGVTYFTDEGMDTDIFPWYEDNGQVTASNFSDITFDAAAFDGMSWGEALEKMLESLGLCLRWQDNNEFMLCAMRRVPRAFGDYSHQAQAVRFVNRSGHRELAPAHKMLIDKVAFDAINGEPDIITGFIGAPFLPPYEAQAYKLDGPLWKTIGTIHTQAHDAYWIGTTGWRSEDTIMVECARSQSTNAYFYRNFRCPSGKTMNISFEYNDGAFHFTQNSQGAHDVYLNNAAAISIKYALVWKSYTGGADRYWVAGDQWDSTLYVRTAAGSTHAASDNGYYSNLVELAPVTPDTAGYIQLRIFFAVYSSASQSNIRDYARVFGVSFKADDAEIIKSHTTKTINNPVYNYRLERSLALGQYPTPISAGVVKNALYINKQSLGYPSIVGWSLNDEFHYENIQFNQLGEYLHRQLLCYLGANMSLLSGELIDLEDDDLRFNSIYHYADKKLYLVGGSLSLITGRIEGAYLREFLDYEDVWGEGLTVDPDYFGIHAHEEFDEEFTLEAEASWYITTEAINPDPDYSVEVSEESGSRGQHTIRVTGYGVQAAKVIVHCGGITKTVGFYS